MILLQNFKNINKTTFLLLSLIILMAYFYRAKFLRFNMDAKNFHKDGLKTNRTFEILLYTRYFGNGWEDKYPVNRRVGSGECLFTNCIVTDSKKRIHSADVVMFHGNDLLSPSDMRKIPRNPQQIWIFMTQENPFTTNTGVYRIRDYNSLFNWTATYRRTAEIVTPYFEIVKSDKNLTLSNGFFVAKKTRLVMAIMSNCIEYRINFIKSLRRYVGVDLYGGCKNKVNPKLTQCEPNNPACDKLQRSYKFFLALENAYCTDYVTEKFYEQALLKGLVPIVLNGAKLSNKRIAPSHSYINVLDFKNLKSLTEYLKYLDANDTAYKAYHKWRESYQIKPHQYFCNLCRTLNKKFKSVKHWKTKDLSKIWSGRSCIRYQDEVFRKYI